MNDWSDEEDKEVRACGFDLQFGAHARSGFWSSEHGKCFYPSVSEPAGPSGRHLLPQY